MDVWMYGCSRAAPRSLPQKAISGGNVDTVEKRSGGWAFGGMPSPSLTIYYGALSRKASPSGPHPTKKRRIEPPPDQHHPRPQ